MTLAKGKGKSGLEVMGNSLSTVSASDEVMEMEFSCEADGNVPGRSLAASR